LGWQSTDQQINLLLACQLAQLLLQRLLRSQRQARSVQGFGDSQIRTIGAGEAQRAFRQRNQLRPGRWELLQEPGYLLQIVGRVRTTAQL
jgi:hypothetical protein